MKVERARAVGLALALRCLAVVVPMRLSSWALLAPLFGLQFMVLSNRSALR